MGTVFAAHELALDRKVAIKVLNSELCRDTQFVARFEQEARSTARLEHPNVVPIHAVGPHGGRPFMVMKKLEGETLAWHLESEGKLSAARTLEIMRQLCAGLGHLHSHGCIHRDIKAGNIFISPDGVATILDLGVVRDLRSERNTQVGTLVGTPRYMSPEQISGTLAVDHRADLYALGVLLYECLTGRAPFESEDNNTVISMHATAKPPDITSIDPELPPALDPVLQRALAKRPDDRFPSAAALLAALEAALSPTRAIRVPDAFTRADRADPQQFDPARLRAQYPTLPGAAPPPARSKSKSRAPRAILAVLLLAVAGVFAWQQLGDLVLPRADPAATRPMPPQDVPRDKPVPELPVPVEPAHPVLGEPRKPEPRKGVDPKRPETKRPKGLAGILKVVTLLGGRPYWASVTVDGVERGHAPVSMELPAAQHTVHLERAGFQTIDQTVIVPVGGVRELRVELVP
jgi:serine/threonine-protein kinase